MFGGAVKRAWTMKGEELNAEGGVLVGDTRYKIEYTRYDDQFDATLSRTKHAFDDRLPRRPEERVGWALRCRLRSALRHQKRHQRRGNATHEPST